jgi:hypothetical protein
MIEGLCGYTSLPLFNNHPDTLGIKLWERQEEIMRKLDVCFVRLVQLKVEQAE